MLYVHSKNYLADDAYMITGSAGVERAGFTNDIEQNVGIFDPTAPPGPRNWVGQFRRNIWAEHLMLDSPDNAILQVGRVVALCWPKR